jgi:G patch domain-containing protein 1
MLPDQIWYVAGFGLGALNDADDDDLDVYDGGLSGNRRLLAYDIAERDDDDTIQIGGRNGKGLKANIVSIVLLTHFRSRFYILKRPASSLTTFRDGKLVLAGFVLSDRPVAEDRW